MLNTILSKINENDFELKNLNQLKLIHIETTKYTIDFNCFHVKFANIYFGAHLLLSNIFKLLI